MSMADIPMKSIQWPGLPDRYTFLQLAPTLVNPAAGTAAAAIDVKDAVNQVQAGYTAADEELDERIDQAETAVADVIATKADKAGDAPALVAGTAEQLLSTTGTVNPTSYTYRENTSGSDRVTISQITGGTVAWNQLVDTATTSVTVASGHKYVALVGGTWSVGTSDGTALTVTGGTDMVFDLTQMFGATVAQHFLDLETSTAGAGVALFREMFPASYYPYNAGELVSVQTSGRKTVGFNLWDEAVEAGDISYNDGQNMTSNSVLRTKNYIPVTPGTTYYLRVGHLIGVTNLPPAKMRWYNSDKSFIGPNPAAYANTTFTAPDGACYLRFVTQTPWDYGTTYRHDICINLSDPARNGVYEPYSAHTYPLDSTLTLRGIPVLTDGVPAYDGDQYLPDGTVARRYMFIPDLGALGWMYAPTNGIFYTVNSAFKGVHETYQVLASGVYDQAKSKYGANFANAPDKIICLVSNQTQLAIKDTSYSDPTEFTSAVSGISAVVALTTPTTETAAPYQEVQIAGSTEEFLPPATDTRAAAVPVGSVSLYQTNLRAGLETLLDTDLAHAESIAPVQGSTASTNISSGELLMKDGKLYQATQAIVAGAEIGSTNTTETTLAAQLAALEARIAALEN